MGQYAAVDVSFLQWFSGGLIKKVSQLECSGAKNTLKTGKYCECNTLSVPFGAKWDTFGTLRELKCDERSSHHGVFGRKALCFRVK